LIKDRNHGDKYMALQVSIPTGKSGNAINSNTGSVTLAEKNGVDAASVENSKTSKKVELDSFTPVKNESTGKTQDIAVNKLDDKELKALEAAGVDTNKTLELPDATNGADSKLPEELNITSNNKGGKPQEASTHKVIEAKDGSNVKNQQQIDVKNEPGETNTKYDQSSQLEIADPGDKLGKGSSGGGLEKEGILYGVVSTEITDDGTPEETRKGNVRAVDLRSKEIQADIGKALNVAA
jgi:hypothetical protein